MMSPECVEAIREAITPSAVPFVTPKYVSFEIGEATHRATMTAAGFAVEKPCSKTGIWKELFPLADGYILSAAREALAHVHLVCPGKPISIRARRRVVLCQMRELGDGLTVGRARILVRAAYRMVGTRAHLDGLMARLFSHARMLGYPQSDPSARYRPGDSLTRDLMAAFMSGYGVGTLEVWRETLGKLRVWDAISDTIGGIE